MRLTRFTVTQYGNFAAEEIVLDPAPGRINLIVAPNGAGKSVLRQAFGDLLFGIAVRTEMDFRFPTRTMRLFAQGVGSDGTAFEFGRRKGQGVTLIDAAGQTLPGGFLDPVLRGAQRPLLDQLFALDTERLRRGGAELLETGGSLADALLSAAGGLRRASALRDELETARDALAPIRKTRERPYYKALDGLLEARRQKKSAALRPDERQRRERALQAAKAELQALDAVYRELAAKRSRMERIRRTRPMLAELDAADSWLRQNPDAPALPADLAQRLAAAREALRRAADALADCGRRRAHAEEEAARVAPDAEILAEADTIAALAGLAGAAKQAWEDLPVCEGKLRAAESSVAVHVRDLGLRGPSEPLGRAAALRAPKPAIRAARRLIERFGELDKALREIPVRLALVQRNESELDAGLARLPCDRDVSALAALLREVRKDGDPALMLQAAQRAHSGKSAAAEEALSRVPGWRGGAAALASLGPAPASVFDRLERSLEDAARTLGSAQSAHARTVEEHASATSQLANLRAGRVLPGVDAISAARLHRDRGWRLIYRQAFEGGGNADEAGAWASGVPLGLAYERAVTAADELADRRAEEQAQLAQAERLERVSRDLGMLAEKQKAEAETATKALSDAQLRWGEACATASLPQSATRADIREFIAARDATLAAERERCAAASALAALAARQAEWAKRLATLIGNDTSAANPCDTLVGEAERMIAFVEETRRERGLIESRLKAVQDLRKTIEDERAAKASLMDNWRCEWRQALAGLGREPDEQPQTISDVLDVLVELDIELDKSAALHERIAGMIERTGEFTRRVGDVARKYGIEEQAPLEVFAALSKRLAAAQDSASRSDELERALRGVRAEQEMARATHTRTEDDLRAIVAAAGAESPEQAEQRIALSMARAQHQTAASRAEARLHEDGEGVAVEILREEAATLAPDEIAATLSNAADEQEQARTAAQAQAAIVSRMEQDMERDSDADAMLRASAAEASELASAGRILEEAMVQHLAGVLLERAMAAVGSGGDAKLLSRIGAAFGALTNGDYPAVLVRENAPGDTRLVVAEHAFPDEEPRELSKLSEGTRDQLYLALRLVAIEDYVAGGSPALPFIADDILQTFDNRRALAALRTLCAFSSTAQVIVLTHHEHVLSLAAGLPPGSVHVHRLSKSVAEESAAAQ